MRYLPKTRAAYVQLLYAWLISSNKQLNKESNKNPFTESKVRRVHWIIITKLIPVINQEFGCWRSAGLWSEKNKAGMNFLIQIHFQILTEHIRLKKAFFLKFSNRFIFSKISSKILQNWLLNEYFLKIDIKKYCSCWNFWINLVIKTNFTVIFYI